MPITNDPIRTIRRPAIKGKTEWVCLYCDKPIARNVTGVCKACLTGAPRIACQKCGAKCPLTLSQLCDFCAPIAHPAEAVELEKNGVKLCGSMKRETYGKRGIQNELILSCDLPNGHNGKHSQTRGKVTHRWENVQRPKSGRPKKPRKVTTRKVARVKQKRCHAPTLSGSFRCARSRRHKGRHQYTFQGKWYEWSDGDMRIRQLSKVVAQ
jgi:hypothetical protein